MDEINFPRQTLNSDKDFTDRSVRISEVGLVYETYDIGPLVKQYAPNGGDADYEYWVTVKPEHINRVLLELIRDKFSDESLFRNWLSYKDIPFDFDSY